MALYKRTIILLCFFIVFQNIGCSSLYTQPVAGQGVNVEEGSLKKVKMGDWFVSTVAPNYPFIPLAKRTEGDVKLAFTITPNGNVIDPQVISSTDSNSSFEKEALRVIKLWKFKTDSEELKSKYVKAETTIHFRLPPTK